MLKLDSVHGGYDGAQILFGVSLEVKAGQCVALMGRNGMGKTTTIRAIVGQLAVTEGHIIRFGVENLALKPWQIARLGIGLVPEGRHVFPSLTVAEHLNAFYRPPRHKTAQGGWNFDKVLKLFPRLKERLHHSGHHLSGGEQQMLAIGRALMTNPRLLVLDEATEGLAPLLRETIWRCLSELKKTGQSILIIDKNLDSLSKLADYQYILEKGQVIWHGPPRELLAKPDLAARYLGVDRGTEK